MAIIDELAKFVVETKYEDIPKETMEYTKELSLKTMAGMVSGTQTESTERLVNYIRENPGEEKLKPIGFEFECSLENAIFVNGYTSHAAELEDDQFPSATSDITIFPVTLPLAQAYKLSGKEYLTASAVGIEVMNRIGQYSLTSIGVTDLPFYGVIGAAVSAAKALSMTEEQIKHAIGIAIGRSSGFVMNFGSDAHYLESAIACKDGYLSAMLAKSGMTGGSDIEAWLDELLQGREYTLANITKGLGEEWYIHKIWVKKYPCCFLTHRQIDMMGEIIDKHGIQPEDVKSIHVEVGPVDGTCDRPNPVDVEDARFSFQHILSGYLIEREMGYDVFDMKKIHDEGYKALRKKVSVTIHDDWPKEFNSGIAPLVVELKNGETIKLEREEAIGGPNSPLTREEHKAIFKKYTTGKLTDDTMEKIAEGTLNVEAYENVSEVVQIDKVMNAV